MRITETTIIYGLVDPNTNKVAYIGLTNNPKARLKQHIKDIEQRHNSPLNARQQWIKDLVKNNQEPTLVILEEVPFDERNITEKRWIEHYRTAGTKLFNRETYNTYSLPSSVEPKALIDFRLRFNLSQAQLAEFIGVHYSAISLWEAGKRRVPKHISIVLESLENKFTKSENNA